jgi:dienelactone hydrolase
MHPIQGAPDICPTINAGIELTGELLRQAGDGLFPALVMLHGCGGPSPKTHAIRAERYVFWGYAALRFDSFAPRGVMEIIKAVLK